MSRLTIDLPDKAHKRLKTVASVMGISMKAVVMISLENFINRKMNKVTERVLKSSESRKNIKKFDSLEALFEDLGI